MIGLIWSSACRMTHILKVLTHHIVAQLAAMSQAKWPFLKRVLPPARLTGPERLRTSLEELGGTFIKFGQMLALQPDVLPFAYCNALFDLMDRVAPFDFAKVEEIFVAETGRKPLDIFDSFEERPLATASIGQVHVAYLNGEKLVVKVQRPSVDTDFVGDIRLMRGTLRLIRKLHLSTLYWMIEPISEFVNWTVEELDYRHEARYMDQLRRNAQENPQEHIPMVYWQFTTRRLLTLEFFDGVTVLEYLRSLETGNQTRIRQLEDMYFEPDAFARHIIDNFLGDAFKYGMFHADLHPANLIILHGNVVGYVDFGITGVLSHYSRRELVSLTLAYTKADVDGMCMAFFKVSAMDADSDIVGFRKGLQQFADEWYEARGDHKKLRKNFTLVMLDMLRLSKQTSIWPERDVIKYIRSSIAIDGLITRFAPDFNVGAYLALACERYLRQARMASLSPAALVDWSYASSRLIREGGYQAMSLLHRMANVKPESRYRGPGDNAGRRVGQLSGFTLIVTLMLLLTDEPVRAGFNLFTAELGLLAVVAALLVHTLYRGR